MDRRNFIKVTAVTGASATLASCGSPELHLARFIPEEELIPGIATWKPSICPLCSAGCGMIVRVMQGEAEVVRNGEKGLIQMGLAKKLEGNPAHPVNQGKLCVRGQAAIQVTYHPDRITGPLKRSGERGAAQFQPISWDQALAELKSQLDTLASANDQKSVAFLTKPLRGQRHTLVSQFLSRFGAPAPIEFEALGDRVLRRANARSFGREQLPTVDLGRSRYVIAFGADFLGTWNSPVTQNIGYGELRQGHPGIRAKFVQVEPRMSQTGANADEWVPVKPGTEGVLALGLAHVIIKSGLRPAGSSRAGAQIEGWSAGLVSYSPADVEKITGVKATRIERLAKEFAQTAPAVAIVGGAPLAHTNGMFTALAVNALNGLVGSVGQPGGILFTPNAVPAQPSPSIDKVAADLITAPKPPVQLLLLNDANPVFGTPPAWRVKEALSKIPFIVSFGHFIDETSALADLILPDHSFLESWVDHVPESGTTMTVASVAPPAMKPLHQTRSMPDVLLEVSRSLARPLTPTLPQSYEEMLQSAFGDDFSNAQQQGGRWSDSPQREAVPPVAAANQRAVAYTDPQFDGSAAEYPFHFVPFASLTLLDGSLAHLPWLQEMPDPISTAMWSSWVEINSQKAAEMGIVQGDLLEIASSQGTLRVPAIPSPAIAPDVIAMPFGQGHQTFTRFATGRGVNPISILAAKQEPETGSLAWAATRVKVTKVGSKSGPILFARGMELEHRPHR